MRPKRYRVIDGVLRFEDGVSSFEDYLIVPEGVSSIDFNQLLHIYKPLRLSYTKLTEIDFKNLITVDHIYLPATIKNITDNLYWANGIHVPDLSNVNIISKRLLHLNVYRPDLELIYLSASVLGMLDKRAEQRFLLQQAGYAVYSPGNHMTLGDPVAEAYPEVVADIDIAALERAQVIFFDLTKLTPGTCAEVGYVAAQPEWIKSKRLYYLYAPTTNFFIKGLIRNFTRVESIADFIERDRYF
jgi:hypothetical protein